MSATNTLLCLTEGWEKLLPPMPTARIWSAAVSTPTHLIVAGGRTGHGDALSVVEILDISTLQWSSVSSSPKALEYPNMTLCDGHLYLSQHDVIFSCCLEELLKSINPTSSNSNARGSMWTPVASIPVAFNATLTTLRGHVLAIGGRDQNRTQKRAVYSYNKRTNTWSVIGEMPTPRACPLVAVLPSHEHELIVVGGYDCVVTEIASTTMATEQSFSPFH